MPAGDGVGGAGAAGAAAGTRWSSRAGTARRPAVVLADGDGASGFAAMLAQLVEENVGDFRSRAFAARIARGSLVVEASDRGMAVTLSFGEGRVVVRDGAATGAPVVAGEWLDMAKLCSGQGSVVGAVMHGRARLRGRSGLVALPAAITALTVPRSFYRRGGPDQAVAVGGCAGAGTGARVGAGTSWRAAFSWNRRRARLCAGTGSSVVVAAVAVCAWRRGSRRRVGLALLERSPAGPEAGGERLASGSALLERLASGSALLERLASGSAAGGAVGVVVGAARVFAIEVVPADQGLVFDSGR